MVDAAGAALEGVSGLDAMPSAPGVPSGVPKEDGKAQSVWLLVALPDAVSVTSSSMSMDPADGHVDSSSAAASKSFWRLRRAMGLPRLARRSTGSP